MSIRRPYKWLGAQRYGYDNNRANQLLTFKAFASPSGVANLDSDLTINGSTVTASYVYYGGDASASGWSPRVGGEDLSLVPVATPPTYNDGSPLLGTDDDSVKFNGSDYFKDTSNTACQIGTEDFVLEVIWKSIREDKYIIDTVATNGYIVLTSSGGTIKINLNDDDGAANITSAAVTESTWNHGICFANRDEVSVNGSQWYINGVASGSGVDISAVEKTLVSTSFSIGANIAGLFPATSNLAYCAMWKKASWHQAGAAGPTEWATIAATRFAQLTGTYPQVAAGTALPTTATRTYPAYLDKVESDGTSKLYQVGAEWMRQCSRKDANGVELKGYLPEPAIQNVALQTEDASTTWALLDAGDTFDLNAINAPNGETTMDGFIADSTDGEHGISQAMTLTATSTAISCYAKKGNKTWVCIEDSTIADCKAFFDVDNGVVGAAPGAGIDALYIEPGKNNDTVRCIAIVTGTAAAHTIKFKSANADGDDDFAGDGSTVNTYMWGFQVECNGLGYATSYVPNTTSANTRLKDELEYVAGANIGGEDVGQGTIAFDWLSPGSYVPVAGYLPRMISLNDGGSINDRVESYLGNSGYLVGIMRASGGNNGDASVSSNMNDNIIKNIRWNYSTNSYSVFEGSTQSTIDTSCDIPDDLDNIYIGSSTPSATAQPACLISNLRIYKEPTEGGS